MQFGYLPADPGTVVRFNYQILNSGHTNHNDIEKALFEGASAIAKAGLASGSPLAVGAAAIIAVAKAIYDNDCDGPVAIDQVTLTGSDLQNLTPTGIRTESRVHQGTDSSDFCGGNSSYTVAWSIVRSPSDAPRLIGVVHLQNIGDLTFFDNDFAGTRGQERRLEGFQWEFVPRRSDLSMRYMAHLQTIGDTEFVNEGAFIGQRGAGLRLEGFAIELTGPAAGNFDVRYMAHIQNIGETKICQNGEFCGTRGQSLRVEAMMVRVDPKGSFINA